MGPCVLREPCFPWHSGATRHNTDAICKMGRSRACTVLPFSEAGARSIKLRHFSPLKEKHCFRRQELGGVALPSLSDWGSCPHSQPSLCRASGWSHTRDGHFPVPPSCPTLLCSRAGLPLGLQSLGQEFGLQGLKNILSWLSVCWVSDALSQGQERCWTLSTETQGQTPLKGGTGRAQDSFTHTFALLLLITRQCLCPRSVTKPPSAGGHCHGHRGLHRQM